MDHFLQYDENDTQQNNSNILDKMVPDNNNFDELRDILSIRLVSTTFLLATMEQSRPKQNFNSAFMETMASDTSGDVRANIEKERRYQPREYYQHNVSKTLDKK